MGGSPVVWSGYAGLVRGGEATPNVTPAALIDRTSNRLSPSNSNVGNPSSRPLYRPHDRRMVSVAAQDA